MFVLWVAETAARQSVVENICQKKCEVANAAFQWSTSPVMFALWSFVYLWLYATYGNSI